ncbi:MAG: hypothetical protein N3G80_04070 [Candidatus Micrarchaeota archaeon]|nr:hypothetical protein [Candidatus Micrarchaeota archaeon]
METGQVIAARLVLLLPAAFLIFLLLESQDKIVRLAAIVGLLLIWQAREWLLLQLNRNK